MIDTFSLIAQDAITLIAQDTNNQRETLEIVGEAIRMHQDGYTPVYANRIRADFHRQLNHECRMLSGIPAHEADRAEIVNALSAVERGGHFE